MSANLLFPGLHLRKHTTICLTGLKSNPVTVIPACSIFVFCFLVSCLKKFKGSAWTIYISKENHPTPNPFLKTKTHGCTQEDTTHIQTIMSVVPPSVGSNRSPTVTYTFQDPDLKIERIHGMVTIGSPLSLCWLLYAVCVWGGGEWACVLGGGSREDHMCPLNSMPFSSS